MYSVPFHNSSTVYQPPNICLAEANGNAAHHLDEESDLLLQVSQGRDKPHCNNSHKYAAQRVKNLEFGRV
jgi:hypothetical protein